VAHAHDVASLALALPLHDAHRVADRERRQLDHGRRGGRVGRVVGDRLAVGPHEQKLFAENVDNGRRLVVELHLVEAV